MPSKRVASKPAAPSATSPSPPLANGLLLGAALGLGLWTLVDRGRVSWPPGDLLANAYTLAGCLALVGPIVLARREAGAGGLGELLWMTGGLLAWIFDLASAVKGTSAGRAWISPLGTQPMGLTILAVLLAGWRGRAGGRDWSWTNVVGWILGLFWVGMGLATLLDLPGLAAPTSTR